MYSRKKNKKIYNQKKYTRRKQYKYSGGEIDINKILLAEHQILPLLLKGYSETQFLDNMNDNILYGQFKDLYDNNITFNTTISKDVYDSYIDVYHIDDMFMKHTKFTKKMLRNVKYEYIYVLNENNTYAGGVWIFYRKDFPFLGMYGIRSSLYNFLQKKRGIAVKILEKVLNIAKNRKLTSIIVPWPLDSMKKILESYKFTEITNINYNSNEMKFMKPVEVPTSYYKYNVLNEIN